MTQLTIQLTAGLTTQLTAGLTAQLTAGLTTGHSAARKAAAQLQSALHTRPRLNCNRRCTLDRGSTAISAARKVAARLQSALMVKYNLQLILYAIMSLPIDLPPLLSGYD